MNAEDKHTRQIEDYLSSAQDDPKRPIFEQNLQKDPELAAAFTEYQNIQGAVEAHLEQKLRQQMEEWDLEEEGQSPQKKGGIKPIYIWIIGLLLLVGAIALILVLNKKEETIVLPQALAREYYRAPGVENTMGAQEQIWLEAQQAYRAANPGEVIRLLTPLEDRNPEMDYFLAHAHYQSGDFRASLPLFEQLAVGSSIYNRRAEWFVVLSHLGNEDVAAAKTVLQNIIKEDRHPFNSRGNDLNQDLTK